MIDRHCVIYYLKKDIWILLDKYVYIYIHTSTCTFMLRFVSHMQISANH